MPDDANREGNIRVVRQKKATTSSGAVPIQARERFNDLMVDVYTDRQRQRVRFA